MRDKRRVRAVAYVVRGKCGGEQDNLDSTSRGFRDRSCPRINTQQGNYARDCANVLIKLGRGEVGQ